MKKSAIGHVVCPVCGHNDAEVKEDKNGKAFIFCPDCATQVFTRNDHRDGKLRGKMRPVTVTVTEPIAPTIPAEPISAASKKQAEPISAATPEPAATEQPKPKKASWFSPVLAQGAK